MPLESATYISDLNASNPVGSTDKVQTLDDHVRLIKSTVKATFPNVTGAMTLTHGNLNALTPFYTDPNADRLMFWDDSAGAFAFLTPSTGLSLSGASLGIDTSVVPQLTANNTFSAPTQTISNATNPNLTISDGTTSGRVFVRAAASGGPSVDIGSISNHEVRFVQNDASRIVLTDSGGITLNGVNVTDYARLSQSNTFTGATQTFSASGDSNRLTLVETSGSVTSWLGTGTGHARVGTQSAHPFRFYTNNTLRAEISSGGDYDFKSGAVTTDNASASEVGFKGVPQNSQSGNYTLVLTDAGKHIFYTGAGGHTLTIPANASVAYPVGTVLTFVASSNGSVTIAITTDSLFLAGSGSTGSRSLSAVGVATAVKVTSTAWVISGSGLS